MDEIYHVHNRSIGEINIFTNEYEYSRFIDAVRFYKTGKPQIKFSDFLEQRSHLRGGLGWERSLSEKEKVVDIIAYCIMPTHFHLLISQTKAAGIAFFIGNLLNSYTRYFNVKYKRKGTLWEGRTKKVTLRSDEQLLHLTRYIHLNPVTAYLVDKPEDWVWSSYREYLLKVPPGRKLCSYGSLLEINPDSYKKFVEDGISYQREMAKAKKDKPTYEVGEVGFNVNTKIPDPTS